MATNTNNPLQDYGYDQATGQSLADSLGISPAQLAAAFAATPMTGGGQNMQGGTYGKSAGTSAPGMDLSNTINQLQIAKAAGMGGAGSQGAQAAQAGAPGQPMNAMTDLGAAALGKVFGGYSGALPVYNPTPTQAGAKSGVGSVASPTVGGSVPVVQSPSVASVFGPGNVGTATVPGQGTMSPGQYAPTAGGTPTPTMPPNAAAAGKPATPWATAPPAPGLQVGGATGTPLGGPVGGAPGAPGQGASPWHAVAAHTDALAQAGQTLYSHLTGNDPANATHADIMGFHNQLQTVLGALPTALQGGAVPGSNYTAGVNQPPNTSPPQKMAAGGLVLGLQYGGYIPDDSNKKKQPPPEVRQQRLTPPGSPAQAQSQPTPTSQQSNQQQQDSSSSGSQQKPGSQGYWSNLVNQAQAAQALNSGGASGGGYNIPGGGGYIGASPGAGQSGYIYPSQSAATAAGDVGTGGGPTGANAAAGVADLAGGVVNALADAAKKYADSIKPWQWQAKQFGNTGTPNYQTTTFQQDEVA